MDTLPVRHWSQPVCLTHCGQHGAVFLYFALRDSCDYTVNSPRAGRWALLPGLTMMSSVSAAMRRHLFLQLILLTCHPTLKWLAYPETTRHCHRSVHLVTFVLPVRPNRFSATEINCMKECCNKLMRQQRVPGWRHNFWCHKQRISGPKPTLISLGTYH